MPKKSLKLKKNEYQKVEKFISELRNKPKTDIQNDTGNDRGTDTHNKATDFKLDKEDESMVEKKSELTKEELLAQDKAKADVEASKDEYVCDNCNMTVSEHDEYCSKCGSELVW